MRKSAWEMSWRRDDRPEFRGGQGVSFVASAVDGSGRQAFIKTLRRPNSKPARGRFRREVAAYETLAGLGPPALIEHNAEFWEDGRTPLYMAIEYIDGLTLQALIRESGPVSVSAALACLGELAAVLQRVHQNGVVHRDIKPANVVLRGADITQPVFVDFGLSFNSDRDDDLTRVGEEIGNRFLRLPEHSAGGRGAASEVTQLAGVFLYSVSGKEPRVLLDEDNKMPHQRPHTSTVLEQALTSRQYLRVMSVLDRAFNTTLSIRYQTALELVSALEAAMRSDTDDGDDSLDELLARVDEVANSRGLTVQRARREQLQIVMTAVNKIVDDFTFPRGFVKSQGGHKEGLADTEAWMQTRLSVRPRVTNQRGRSTVWNSAVTTAWFSSTTSRCGAVKRQIPTSHPLSSELSPRESWRHMTMKLRRAEIVSPATFAGCHG